MTKTFEIRVRGLVQGVGFRPFIYRLAKKHDLKGFVLNDSEGVKISVSGLNKTVDKFIDEIKEHHPPLSEIVSIDLKKVKETKFDDFSIVESSLGKKTETLISPDIATCKDCFEDFTNPENRRYLYPFTNCTNCGPRFTIIEKLPYDRPNTTMSEFSMCKSCRKEYTDPLDRRFHAQPNACPECGPTLKLYGKNFKLLKTENPLRTAIDHLKNGKIVIIKGLGGFHLACDATSNETVSRLRIKKGREEKPLAIMAADAKRAQSLAKIGRKEKALLESPERPIVLLEKKPKNGLASSVSPANKNLGILLPYTPLHHLLFLYDTKTGRLRKKGVNFKALVMTSANVSEEPILIDELKIENTLKGAYDYLLTHNRDIFTRTDDSVLLYKNGPVYIRRSRGFAPAPIFLKSKMNEILAVGSELKNTVCITKGNNAFLSQYIGDLKDVDNFDFFKEATDSLKDTLKIYPKTIAFDMHPNYLNSKFAMQSRKENKIAVQHHHAHMASCMAENNIDSTCIGIILDGTGYGIDGTVWGGEVLLGDLGSFERKANLRQVKMPGGDVAAKEPYRMAFSYLHLAYGKFWKNLDFDFINRIGRDRLSFLERMLLNNVNSPYTSSLGRLFDAVSSLRGVRDINSYEGQAAIELEMSDNYKTKDFYPYTVYSQDTNLIINTVPMIEEIVNDLTKNRKTRIRTKFHNTIVNAFTKVAKQISKESGIKDVVLSGGCFQNIYLLQEMIKELKKGGLKVYTHRKVPTNDGGISLGQACVADKLIK